MFSTNSLWKGVPENKYITVINNKSTVIMMTNGDDGENDDGNDAVCDGDDEGYDGNIDIDDDDDEDAVSQ